MRRNDAVKRYRARPTPETAQGILRELVREFLKRERTIKTDNARAAVLGTFDAQWRAFARKTGVNAEAFAQVCREQQPRIYALHEAEQWGQRQAVDSRDVEVDRILSHRTSM